MPAKSTGNTPRLRAFGAFGRAIRIWFLSVVSSWTSYPQALKIRRKEAQQSASVGYALVNFSRNCPALQNSECQRYFSISYSSKAPPSRRIIRKQLFRSVAGDNIGFRRRLENRQLTLAHDLFGMRNPDCVQNPQALRGDGINMAASSSVFLVSQGRGGKPDAVLRNQQPAQERLDTVVVSGTLWFDFSRDEKEVRTPHNNPALPTETGAAKKTVALSGAIGPSLYCCGFICPA
jgi:hypothetical protein